MGRSSGGSPHLSDFLCLCLVNNNDDENIENWISCVECKNWYHRKCYLISDEEYNAIIGGCKDWYCPGSKCQKVFSFFNDRNGNVDKRPVRERLVRECKVKSVGSSSGLQPLSGDHEFGRVTCGVCGFLAKNAHGLSKIWIRSDTYLDQF